MSLLKKWIGCIISFVAGVCGLALSACSGMVAYAMVDATTIGGAKTRLVDSTTKAFKVLTDSDLYTEAKEFDIGAEFMWMKVFAIITLVISILLIAYAIIMLLKNLNVIKCDSKIFDIIGIVLGALFLIATIGLLITSNIYANAMEDAVLNLAKGVTLIQLGGNEALLDNVKFDVNVKLGVYQPTILVIAIITAIVVGTFTFIKRKDA